MVSKDLTSTFLNGTQPEAEFPQPCLGVVFIPTDTGLKIPLFKRSNGDDQWWDLPGGKRAITEHPFDCVSREMNEELGIRVRPYSFISSMPHPKFGEEKARHFIACMYQEGTPSNMLPEEHDALELCSPQEAIKRLQETGRVSLTVVNFINAYTSDAAHMSLPTPIKPCV